MQLLALDTATEACSAAVLVDGALLERYAVLGRGHAEHLLPMVDELLAESGLALRDCDAIAFGRGPGAFTGVRIAVSLAQGLALGAERPVVGISDLAALGRVALDAAPGVRTALACLDARMGEVYWAAVRARADGGVDLAGEHLGRAADVALPESDGPFVAAGHGWSAYPVLAERFGARVHASLPDLLPRAAAIARLAALEVAAGRVSRPEYAAPVYLRDDVATRSGRAGARPSP
jgi:tRNA threonylcarbamoyladenosine biosynthesis protein TsaB